MQKRERSLSDTDLALQRIQHPVEECSPGSALFEEAAEWLARVAD